MGRGSKGACSLLATCLDDIVPDRYAYCISSTMILRSGGLQLLRRCARKPILQRSSVRKYTTPPATFTGPAVAAVHPLVTVTSQLDRVTPRFEIDPSAITILDSPAAFYETLKVLRSPQLSMGSL